MSNLKNDLKARDYAPVLKPVRFAIDGDTSTIANMNDMQTPAGGSGTAYGLVLTSIATAKAGGVDPKGFLKAEKVWGSVWNDYADFQLLCDELLPGKCYIDTKDGAMLATERCQLSVIGIASDTFGNAVGQRDDVRQVPIAVSGWALAYVDQEYPCGTPLTNDENGNLTEMTLEEKRDYPERLVAIYKRKELEEQFGTETLKINVNGRHWVKVK